MKTEYKTSRKYKCPYCDLKAIRNVLIDHVDKKHTDVIPEGYTAARAVYDYINGRNYGICMVCKEKVFKWNDRINRYYNLCDKPECRAKVREMALKNHIKIYNKPSLLDDPEHQQKMLANRKISGTYTFSDGGKVTYTGSYEKKALEFIDTVLNIPSKDIQAPGPTLEYEYNGEKHLWITDIYYIPANLLIEIKDGGSNPNNRSMVSYREKQIAKEEMVTNLGTFNYIRLTNNDFSQLLAILAEMKAEAMENDDPKAMVRINEEVGGLPPHNPPEAYIIPYGQNNVFSGFAYSDSTSDDIAVPADGTVYTMSKKEFHDKYQAETALIYTGNNKEEKINSIRNAIKENSVNFHPGIFAEMLIGRSVITFQDVVCSECFTFFNKTVEKKICEMLEAAVHHDIKEKGILPDVVDMNGWTTICKCIDGYYAVTPEKFKLMSNIYPSMQELIDSGSIDFMNNIYRSVNRREKEEESEE